MGELRQGKESPQHDVPEHAVEAIDKVQTQKDMIGMKLKESLDLVDNGFSPP